MATTFDCPRCGYQAKRKQALQTHLKRKTPCQPIKADISQEAALSAMTKPAAAPVEKEPVVAEPEPTPVLAPAPAPTPVRVAANPTATQDNTLAELEELVDRINGIRDPAVKNFLINYLLVRMHAWKRGIAVPEELNEAAECVWYLYHSDDSKEEEASGSGEAELQTQTVE
jgi:hypothetical protein